LFIISITIKGVGKKISRGEANGKEDRKIALLSLFQGGPTEKIDRKIAKKHEKNKKRPKIAYHV